MFIFFNQSTVSTAKQLASLFWYLIASTSRGIHIALRAWSLDSKSIIPIPPSKISPISVFLFILSVLFHKKLYFINFLSGYSSKILVIYISLDRASVLIIVHFPKNRQFSSFPRFKQFLNLHPVFIIAF